MDEPYRRSARTDVRADSSPVSARARFRSRMVTLAIATATIVGAGVVLGSDLSGCSERNGAAGVGDP